MRVVVTGANGFVGLHTVRGLLDAGYDVLALDVMDSRLAPEFKGDKRCRIVTMSILDKDLRKIINKEDKVLHLAAIARFDQARQNPQKAVAVNIEGTLNIIQACIMKKVERLVYASTGSVYSHSAPIPIREDAKREPGSIYGLTKKHAEDWIFLYGESLPYVILRYGYVYGKDKDWGAVGAFLKRLREGERPVIFGGMQTNDFIYIKDIVQANLLALETEHVRQAYNVGSGRAISIKDVCEACIAAVKTNLTMEIKPARIFDFPVFVYDISKAQTLLNFEPKWNLSRGIEDILKQ
ncbi:MAG: NAD-dependent epimerase/dehydratase family protein [Candidatus Bathyarchaeota archaeon]|nr:MAG: NAD-dependent epimerase/dehydratase family protein [Candidatus Bathyarchaeota archaeon]